MEEAELVRKMISGDKDAFAGLMEIYQKQALRAAYLISGNYADSEDIVQETFTSCYINQGSRSGTRRPLRAGSIRPSGRRRVAGRPDGNSPAEEVYPEEKRLRAGF